MIQIGEHIQQILELAWEGSNMYDVFGNLFNHLMQE